MADQKEKIIMKIDKDLKEIVPIYLQMTAEDVDSMRRALKENDFETLRTIGHNFKGNGSGYGFDLITEIGSKIEKLAKMKQGEQIAPLIDELNGFLNSLKIVYE